MSALPGDWLGGLPNAFRVNRVEAVPYFYGFIQFGDLVAVTYDSAGQWVEDRGTLPGVSISEFDKAIIIVADDGGNVASGSLAWKSAGNQLTVWDVDAEATYTYTAALGTQLSAPVFHVGELVWIEIPSTFDSNTVECWIRHADADLTGVATLASFSESVVLGDGTYLDDFRVAATASHFLARFLWENETVYTGTVRDVWAGGSPEFDDTGALGVTLGLADSTGAAVGLNGDALVSVPDSTDATSSPRWPTTGDWALDSANNHSVSTDHNTALVYGVLDVDAIALVAPSNATTGDPTLRVTLAAHPTLDAKPDLLFLMT